MTDKQRLEALLKDACGRQDHNKIITLCTAELMKDPKQPLLLKERAAAFEQVGLLEKAIADLDCLAVAAPAPDVFEKLVRLSLSTGSLTKATNAVAAGLSHFPSLGILRDLQKSLKQQLRPSASLQELLKWLDAIGASFVQLKLAEFSPTYRGLVAAEFIQVRTRQKKERVLCVPQAYVLTLDLASSTTAGALVTTLNLYSPKHSLLAVYLMFETRRVDSHWAPYLRSLPQDCSAFPIFYGEAEQTWLKGSPFLLDVAARVAEMERDFSTLCECVPEFSEFTREEFFAMRMLVCSRLFGVTMNGESTVVMVPLADMLNHHTERNCYWYFCEATGQFVVETVRNVHKGSELCVRYGHKCNSRLLMHYGFVAQQNPANEFPFRLRIASSDRLLKRKQAFLGARIRCIRARADMAHGSFYELFSMLRVLCIDDEAFLEVAIEGKTWDQVNAVSAHVERQVLRHLLSLTEKALDEYPTSIEEDQTLIQTGLSGNQLNCVLLRLGEKEVLQWYRDLASTCLPLLDLPRVCWEDVPATCPYKSYCLSALVSL